MYKAKNPGESCVVANLYYQNQLVANGWNLEEDMLWSNGKNWLKYSIKNCDKDAASFPELTFEVSSW